jgi:hypothetical protein
VTEGCLRAEGVVAEVTPSKRVKREAAAVVKKEQPAAAVGTGEAEAEDVKPDLKRIAASKEKPTPPRSKKAKAEVTEAAVPSPITPSPMQAKTSRAVKKVQGVKGVKKEQAAASPAAPGMSSTYPTFRRPSPEVRVIPALRVNLLSCGTVCDMRCATSALLARTDGGAAAEELVEAA